MPRRTDPAAELAAKMLTTLQTLRARGDEAYPPTLTALGRLADPQASPELALKAVGRKPFPELAVVAAKKALAAPVALREDLDRLAVSPVLLQFALDSCCTPAKPTWPVGRLAKRLALDLRPGFADSVVRRITGGTLPPGVGVVPGKGRAAPQLYLERLPPPKKPDEALAERLLRVLEGQRRLGAGSYPTTLRRLAELTDPEAPTKLLDKAAANPLFAGAAFVAVKKNAAAPVALRADLDRLAASPQLLDLALQLGRTEANQAFGPADLQKKVTADLRRPFLDAVRRQIEARTLPPGVGCVTHKGKPLLFRLGEVLQGESLPAAKAATAAPAPAFGHAFAEAFDCLQGRAGAENYVNLLDLRRALPAFDRAAFDAGLQRLRQAGVFRLRLADGRFGISPEEREAGIPTEDGALWLFVSRNAP